MDLELSSRERILRAGRDLLVDHPPDLRSGLSVTGVTAGAGLSPGTFYLHWPKQDSSHDPLADYADELMVALEERARARQTAPVVDAMSRELRRGQGLDAALHAAGSTRLEPSGLDAEWRLVQIERLASLSDEGVLRRARESYARTTQQYGEVLADGLQAAGLEPVPPHSNDDLAIVFLALCEGMRLRAAVDRPTVTDAPAGDPDGSLLGDALQALVSGMTRPCLNDQGEVDP